MDPKVLKVTITEKHHFDLLRILLNELNIKFENYQELPPRNDIVSSPAFYDNNTIKTEREYLQKANSRKQFLSKNKKFNFWYSKNTCDQIITAIRARQQKYLITGKKSDLCPMIYKDIADELGRDISTVARIAHVKKIVLNGEIIFYRELFKEGLLKTKDGRSVTQYEFFDEILRIINTENKQNPFTDDDIVEELKIKGYQIARRTIAKYRDVFLKIPNSNQRRIK